jgi:hypothetical protein
MEVENHESGVLQAKFIEFRARSEFKLQFAETASVSEAVSYCVEYPRHARACAETN